MIRFPGTIDLVISINYLPVLPIAHAGLVLEVLAFMQYIILCHVSLVNNLPLPFSILPLIPFSGGLLLKKQTAGFHMAEAEMLMRPPVGTPSG